MLVRIALVVLISGVATSAVLAAPLTPNQRKAIEEFEVGKEPAPRDWKAFHKAPPAFRQALWTYHQKRGIGFKGWSWGWRMGWVRACAQAPTGYCSSVLNEALADKALVVRAEAATQLGRIYDGTKDRDIANKLIVALKNPKNFRAGKPLFVQQRILFALHQIGNKDTASEVKKVASGHPDLAVYWQRVTQVSL